MKKRMVKVNGIILGIVLSSLFTTNLHAQYALAAGIRLGGTSGVSGKYFYKPDMAVEGIVGVLLVFSSLIIPVLATQHAPPRRRLFIAYNLGAASYLIGILLSAILDISPGAAIVCALAIDAVIAAKLIQVFTRPRAEKAAPAQGPTARDRVQPTLSKAA